MSQIIQFVNNTSDTILIQGVDAAAFSAPFSGSLTCSGGNCTIAPGSGSAKINDLSSFQLNGGADFAFSGTIASNIPAINPSSIGGANQGNYSAACMSTTSGFSFIIDDTSIVAGTIQFINNTNDVISIQGVANPLDCSALNYLTSLTCLSGVYSLTANTQGSATIGDLSVFEAFSLGSTNFMFDVILGINLIAPDLNAPSTQANYIASIALSNNQYTIEIDQVQVTSSLIIINNTEDTVIIQGIDQSAFTASSFLGALTCSGGNCTANPGTGAAVIATISDFKQGFILNGGADFAFSANLGGATSQIGPSPFGGVNQALFAAKLEVNGTQFIITISKTPLNPTILFINNTSYPITLESSLDSSALTNLTAGLTYNGTNYVQTTGVGTGVIGDIPALFTFTLNSLSLLTFTVNLGTAPSITLPVDYVGSISLLGNLTTITIQAAPVPIGPGTLLTFAFTGSLTELLFSQPIQESDRMNFFSLLRSPIAVEATFNPQGAPSLTLNAPAIGVLNATNPNQMIIDSTTYSGDVILDFSDDRLPVVSLYSQSVIPINTTPSPEPFLFSLSETGTSSVSLTASPSINITLNSETFNPSAYYTFDLSGPSIPKIANVSSFNTGSISSKGCQFTFVLPTKAFQVAAPSGVSGTIQIKDSSQTSNSITFTIPQTAITNGIASFQGSGTIYGSSLQSLSGILNLQGDLDDNPPFPMITISGRLNPSLPEFYYNRGLTGIINLTFNT